MSGNVLTKNTYGKTVVSSSRIIPLHLIGTFGGSSLTRKEFDIEKLIREPLEKEKKEKKDQVRQLRSMSARTKSKIRTKIIAFSRVCPKLTFVTLTFVNQIEDKKAIKILRAFLDNVSKRSKDFQYLWVAERQTKNVIFPNNIHFHLMTNKYWDIQKWLRYWVELQEKNGITRRDTSILPGSAFDVRQVSSNNIKGVINYLTKYVTKNNSEFDCQVWNCSKKISRLYTDFYAGLNFLKELERMQEKGQLGGALKKIRKEFCNLFLVPLNRITLSLYTKIDEQNKLNWKNN